MFGRYTENNDGNEGTDGRVQGSQARGNRGCCNLAAMKQKGEYL